MFHYLITLIVIIVIYLLVSGRKDPRLPPGRYGWPVIGSLPIFQFPTPEKIEEYRKKFGDIFMWRLGNQHTVYLCTPSLIRKAFKNPHLNDKPKQCFSIDSFSGFSKIGILNSVGKRWETQKKFVVRNLKTTGGVKVSLEDLIQPETELLIKKFKDHFSRGPATLPVVSMASVSINVTSKLISGVRFDEDDESLKKISEAITQHLFILTPPLIYLDQYPWIVPFIPKFILNKFGFGSLQARIDILRDFIKNLIAQKKESFDGSDPKDLIESYLLEIQKADGKETYFSEKALIIIISELFAASGDDFTLVLRFGLEVIASHPETQRRIQEEIDSVVTRDRLPSLIDKQSLPFTEAAVLEILRIALLVPLGFLRTASEDMMIENYFIPKGTIVAPFLHRCHTDSEYWERPDEFYPEHFLDTNGKFAHFKEAFMPFSTGSRSCPGENLARPQLFLYISAVLQTFSLRMADEESFASPTSSKTTVYNSQAKLIVEER